MGKMRLVPGPSSERQKLNLVIQTLNERAFEAVRPAVIIPDKSSLEWIDYCSFHITSNFDFFERTLQPLSLKL